MGANPFVFSSSVQLTELTGLKASNLIELLEHINLVGGSSIYHHTHHFLQQHLYLSPEPPNDFAYWISEILGDSRLGEELASIDIISHQSIRLIRESIVKTIEKNLKDRPRLKTLVAVEGEEFNFLKSVSFVFTTPYKASTLKEFADCLRQISIHSIYFHMFEARLRLERANNDFSNWLSDSLNENQLALRIARLDPYTFTGESLRSVIIDLVEKRILSIESKEICQN